MRSFLCAIVLLTATLAIAETTVVYPMGVVPEATDDTGIFRDRFQDRQPRFRKPKPSPQPGQQTPPADGNRTEPVDPDNPPKFEGAPSDGSTLPINLTELTPEQKQQLTQAIIAIISALIGAFAGSGKAGPFLSALLQAFKGIANPVPGTPAKIRKRKSKAKAKLKSPAPDVAK